MIELLIGGGVLAAALLMGKNKNTGTSSEYFEDPEAFVPQARPKPTGGQRAVNTALNVAAALPGVVQTVKTAAGSFNFKKKPGATSASKAVQAAQQRQPKRAAKGGATSAASAAVKAAKEKKQSGAPKIVPVKTKAPKNLSQQEIQTINWAIPILRKLGVDTNSELDVKTELQKLNTMGTAKVKQILKQKGVSDSDITILIRAANIVLKK